MSEFSRRLLAGEATTDEQWRAHLVDVHSRAPGLTPSLIETPGYEVLADALRGDEGAVLDLGCGSGPLLSVLRARLGASAQLYGVDLVASDLELARGSGSNADLRCESAHELSLDDCSVDAVLCHLSFELMRPIEAVVAQVARVLRPGGMFAAAFQGRSDTPWGDSVKEILAERANVLAATGPDPRATTEQGWHELFSRDAGFTGDLEIEDYTNTLVETPAGLWDILCRGSYGIELLPAAERDQLGKRIVEAMAPYLSEDGTIAWALAGRRFVARRQ